MARRGRRRKQGGFGFWGPFPSYSRRTQRGSFRVTGCCLPLALGMGAVPLAGLRLMLRRR